MLYIVKGRARFRWGDHLEFSEEAGPGDFIYVPPYVPHQEMNARADEPVEAVVVRSGQEPIVVNLDIAEAGRDSRCRSIPGRTRQVTLTFSCCFWRRSSAAPRTRSRAADSLSSSLPCCWRRRFGQGERHFVADHGAGRNRFGMGLPAHFR